MVWLRTMPVAAVLWSTVVSAEIIWDQPWDGNAGAFIAQDFSDASTLSAFQLDDFTTTQPYYLDRLTAPGFEAGPHTTSDGKGSSNGTRLWVDAAEILDAAASGQPNEAVKNNSVVAEIWEGLPGSFGGHKVMGSVSGGEEMKTGTLVINFGGQRLPPGQYWVSVYVVRPLSAGGQWFWLSTEKVTGSEHQFYTPGKGYGMGKDPVPASQVPYAEEHVRTDMAFTLQGRATGEETPARIQQAPGPAPAPPTGAAAPSTSSPEVPPAPAATTQSAPQQPSGAPRTPPPSPPWLRPPTARPFGPSPMPMPAPPVGPGPAPLAPPVTPPPAAPQGSAPPAPGGLPSPPTAGPPGAAPSASGAPAQ
jgi:hypothetical protein